MSLRQKNTNSTTNITSLGEVMTEAESYQEDLDGSQDVHGSSEGGAQVKTDPHGSTELWTQRAADHEVGTSSWMEGRGYSGGGRKK